MATAYSRAKFGRLYHLRKVEANGVLSNKAQCGFEPSGPRGYSGWRLPAMGVLTYQTPCSQCLKRAGD